jgi:hypothetical protein
MLYSYSSGAVDMLPGMVQPGMPWSKNKAKIQNNQIRKLPSSYMALCESRSHPLETSNFDALSPV